MAYINGETIKKYRKKKGYTQSMLAEELGISAKTISKWETGRGFPDISLLEPLAKSLNLSLMELMQGKGVSNCNQGGNLRRSNWYVCPNCGNAIWGQGACVVSCCGFTLPALKAEVAENAHGIMAEEIDGQWYISMEHEMEKGHYISFMALVEENRVQIVKLYPEQNGEARFMMGRAGDVYAYCSQDGLFKLSLKGLRKNNGISR